MKKLKISKEKSNSRRERKVPIQVKRGQLSKDLRWTTKEEKKLVLRIKLLREDQIAALARIVGIEFAKKDIARIFRNVKKSDTGWVNILPIIYEASSKDDLLWWLEFFEQANKK